MDIEDKHSVSVDKSVEMDHRVPNFGVFGGAEGTTVTHTGALSSRAGESDICISLDLCGRLCLCSAVEGKTACHDIAERVLRDSYLAFSWHKSRRSSQQVTVTASLQSVALADFSSVNPTPHHR